MQDAQAFFDQPGAGFFQCCQIGAIADGEPAPLLDIPAFGFLRTLVAPIIGVIVI